MEEGMGGGRERRREISRETETIMKKTETLEDYNNYYYKQIKMALHSNVQHYFLNLCICNRLTGINRFDTTKSIEFYCHLKQCTACTETNNVSPWIPEVLHLRYINIHLRQATFSVLRLHVLQLGYMQSAIGMHQSIFRSDFGLDIEKNIWNGIWKS